MSDGGKENENGTIVYRSEPDTHEKTRLSTSILDALDSVPDYNVENSETVVFDHVDLDALDELFTRVDKTSRQGTVTFPVAEYQVTATAAGEITVRKYEASSR